VNTQKPQGLSKIWREIKRPFRKLVSHRDDERNTFLEPTVCEQMSTAWSINNLHQTVFPKYKNIHRGKNVVIVATGPSLTNYEPIKDAVHIGVNRAFLYEKVELDYLFAIDYPNVQSYIAQMNEYRQGVCKKFYGICREFPNFIHIPESETLKAHAERYYIDYNAFEREEIFYHDLSSCPLASFWTVVFQAIQFALWTSPQKLYLAGCDESDLGHFNGDKQLLYLPEELHRKQQHFIKHMKGWEKLKDFVRSYYPETEIISINPVGLKGLFEDMYQGKVSADYTVWKNVSQTAELKYHAGPNFRTDSEVFRTENEKFWKRCGFDHNDFRGKTVLDVGAGSKLRGKYFEDTTIIAIEPLADEFIKSVPWHDLNDAATLYSLPAESLIEEQEGNSDFVFSVNVLDHCFDFEKIIQCIFKYLKNDGLAFLAFDVHKEPDDCHPLILTEEIASKIFTRVGFYIENIEQLPSFHSAISDFALGYRLRKSKRDR
jgi:SAM-dependent methyltransferase